MKNRLSARLFLLIAAVFALAAAIAVVFSFLGLRAALARQGAMRAASLAREMAVEAPGLLSGNAAGSLQEELRRRLAREDLAYIVLTGPDGAVAAHAFAVSLAPEVARAIASGAPKRPDVRNIRLADGRVLVQAAQPAADGRGGGVLIGLEAGSGGRLAGGALGEFSLVLAVFSFCLGAVFFGVRRISAPLERLAADARRAAAGEFSGPFETRDRGEAGALAKLLNALAGRVSGLAGELEQTRGDASKSVAAMASLSAVLGSIADGLLVVDDRGVILRHNSALVRMFGMGTGDLAGRTCAEALGSELAAVVRPRSVERDDVTRLTEVAVRRADGGVVPVEIAIAPMRLAGCAASVSILRDISQAKRLDEEREASRVMLERRVEERTRELSRMNVQLKIEVAERKVVGDALRRAEAKFRGIFENAAEGIYQVTPEGRYLSANPAMASIFCFASPGEAVTELSKACPYVEPTRRETFLAAMEENGLVQGFESQVRRKDDVVIWISENARKVTDSGGGTLYYEGFVDDITLRKEAESRLVHQAFHDPLTGLPNRQLFLDHLRMAMDRARRRQDFRFAVLYMDLDRFKIINDSLGHDIGDRLLRHVGSALLACVRSTDTVARFGGDEFAILLEDISAPRDAIRFCRRILAEIAKSMELAGREVQVTASLGIVLHTDGYERPEALLRDADTAMYHAKAMGKSRFKVFNKRMHHQAQELMEMEMELRQAVNRQQLCLMFQPIVDIRERRLAGFEALIRWPREDGGMTPPSEFIPLAEETGIIYPLDNWVFAEACRAVKEFERAMDGAPPEIRAAFATNINISARHFRNPLLVGHMEQVMRECAVQPRNITVEITESVLLDNGRNAREVAAKLRELGLKLCIDDFGTGYSSLSYIQRFSVDAIKIDRGFVGGVTGRTSDPGSEAIVRTIVTLGAGLGLKVVAEGVETPGQLAFLQSLNCRFAQGYLFAPALSREAAVRLVAEGAVNEWPNFPEIGQA